jgi:hypothetical protein
MNALPWRAVPIALLLALVCAIGGSVSRATVKCGPVCDEVWNVVGNPYEVTCDVTVAAGCSLQVEAGVEVRFSAGTRLQVEGTLDVDGVASNEIFFTSDAVAPEVSDWTGLWLSADSIVTLDHADIRYADNALFVTDGSSVTLTDVTLQWNNYALLVDGAGPPTVFASGCTIVENDQAGVEVWGSPNPSLTIHDSSIHDNALGGGGPPFEFYAVGFEDADYTVLDARGNWWGNTNAVNIAMVVHDRRFGATSPIIDFCGHLDGPGGSPARDVHCPELVVCDEDAVWAQTDRPYQLVTDLRICPTGRLRVEAGVEVRTIVMGTHPAKPLFISEGVFEIAGTEPSPVTFTSDTSTPTLVDWSGLRLKGSSTTIDHAIISHAEKGIWTDDDCGVNINDAAVTHSLTGIVVENASTAIMKRVTLQSNSTGLRVRGPATVDASECTFTDNDALGVEAEGPPTSDPPLPDAVVTLRDSSIHSNGGTYDLSARSYENPSESVVDARGNWWGTTESSTISSRIHDRHESSTAPVVDWCAYLDGPGGAPARDVACPDPVVCGETVVWDETSKPYLLVSDLYVCPTGTLQIEAGVDVRVIEIAPALSFLVHGTLDVNGTAPWPVTFASDEAVPEAGDWSGLSFAGTSLGYLDHAEITGAARGIDAQESSALSLTGVTSRNSTNGLYVYGAGPPTVSASGCAFTENASYGVHLRGTPNPDVTITASSIHSNLGSVDLFAQSYESPDTSIQHARENWWGSTDPAVIGPRIYDHRYSSGSPVVDWCRFLDGPGGTPVRDAHCPDLVVCDETVVWDQTDRPYQVTSDLWVCPTGTLQIEAGVEARTVATTPKPDFLVEGILDVNGTGGAPVLLTSDADLPGAGDWSGPYLTTGSTTDLEHATITYADEGVWAHGDAQLTLTGVTAQHNTNGLYVQGAGPPTVIASDCTFTENASYGVYLRGNPNPDVTVTASSIHSNLGSVDFIAHLYESPDMSIQFARDNWWGSTDPAVIGPRIYDHRYASGSPVVDWCRYLDGPGGAPVRDAHCPDLVVCDETVVWDQTDRPYQVTSDLWVCPTGTLQVEAGVEARTVATSPKPDFLVEGILDVNGTAGAPVVLTSDTEVPGAGDWSGPYLTTGSASDLEHATITYADNGVWAHGDAQVTLTGVTLQHNMSGLYVNGAGPPAVDASGCTFTDNESYGVHLLGDPDPDVTVTASSIHSNLGSVDFIAQSYATPYRSLQYARDNWWGSTDQAVIGPRIYDHRYHPGSPVVDWCRYLDGPGGTPVRDAHCPDLVVCDETEVWDQTDRPYQVTSDLWVCPTGTLQIEAGVEARTVATSPKPDFLVEGILDVNGTTGSPAVLTSDADVPGAGDWSGPYLTTGSTSALEHATVTYADNGVWAHGDAQVTLTGVTLQHNTNGLFVDGAGPPTVRASACTFTENASYGVYLMGDPNPDVTVTASSIHSNLGSVDFIAQQYELPDTSIAWATDNWWGTTDEAAIRERIFDREDNAGSPWVYHRAFGEECDFALGHDDDSDGLGDFEDNCPEEPNATQMDSDGDLMGDACDPEPGVWPSADCDGFDDETDGYADSDGDGWGDPCDFQPTRSDSYPGAPEKCDARDNDGDASFGPGESTDEDLDEAIACGDCDDFEAEVHVCACEQCANVREDDCDGLMDGADPDCEVHPNCIVLATGAEPGVTLGKGECGGATVAGPFDVIRGNLDEVAFSGGSVDLGPVGCVEGGLIWDRVTDWSPDPNYDCHVTPVVFYLARNAGDPDFGSASSGEPRDTMVPDPPCP